MDYIVPAFSMLALDTIYLSNIGGPLFDKMVRNIQKEEMKLNLQYKYDIEIANNFLKLDIMKMQ